MKQNTKNLGVTLMALIITIIISLILISVTIFAIKNTVDNASLTNFGNEINDIQDATKSYYVLKNEIPKKEDENSMTKSDVLSLVNDNNKTSFEEELSLNGDASSEEFYKLDLSKIEVEKTNKGLETRGQDDIYIISYPSINVYYLKGIKVKNKMYYSIINVVENKNISSTSIDTSETSIQTVAFMSVGKNNAKWTNKMGITIKSEIKVDEEIYIELSGANISKKLNLQSGVEIKFDSLSELNSLNILESALTATNITDFDNTIGTKQINIIKKQSGIEIGRIKLDLSNYDNGLPFVSNVVLNNYDNMNSLNLVLGDENGSIKSGVKEVRYDYLTKYNENSNTTSPYYNNITSFDVNYMLNTAKKSGISKDNIVDIKIPKDVNVVKVAVVDNAGNVEMLEYDILSKIYISQRVTSFLNNYLSFTLYINSQDGIDKVDTYVSTDGVNYANQKTVVVNTLNTYTTLDYIYEDLASTSNIVFVKVIVTDKQGKVDTKIFSCGEGNKTNDDYIKDGLILNYDGINNTGSGHINTQSFWRDLSIKKNDGIMQGFITNDSNSGFRENSLKFDGVNDTVDTKLPGATTFNADSDFTMSVMFDFNTVTATGAPDSAGEGDTGIVLGCAFYSGYGIAWTTPVQGDTNNIVITSFLRVNSNSSRITKNINATDKKICFTQVYSKSKNSHSLYCNGVLVNKTTAATADAWFDGDELGNIGINKDQIYSGNARPTYVDMSVYNAKIYNRALSEDEIKVNYSVDRVRYGM
jgi:Tfp pilus assembly protein PilE